ncbi:MAG: hypothetical protein HN348_30820, partial [Proteobacteria bacterium]|nr:hypothetical protein [Pseudomonadota bacterium]
MKNARHLCVACLVSGLFISHRAVATDQQGPNIQIQPTGLPLAYETVFYRHTLKAETESAVWSIVEGQLPPGLNLEGNQILGMPTAAVDSLFVVQASLGAAVEEKQMGMVVLPAPSVDTAEVVGGRQGIHYEAKLTAKSGLAPYTWQIVGRLPPGIELVGDKLVGVPEKPGSWCFIVRVLDVNSAFDEVE